MYHRLSIFSAQIRFTFCDTVFILFVNSLGIEIADFLYGHCYGDIMIDSDSANSTDRLYNQIKIILCCERVTFFLYIQFNHSLKLPFNDNFCCKCEKYFYTA